MLKINLDQLIWSVQNHFDNEASYILESKKKPQWKRTQEEAKTIAWHERNAYGSSNAMNDLVHILNVNYSNLYTIARAAGKWERKHNWERCFPAQEHQERILKYLAK